MAAKSRKVFGTGLALCALAAVLAATQAARPASAATCPPPPTPLQPFTPWADNGQYVLTTGGSFEPGTPAWTLTGGAKVVNDNAPNRLDPPSHASALFMFFAKNTGAPDAGLKVEILVKGKTYQAGTITGNSAWAPTKILPSSAPAYKGAVTYQVRLTVVGTDGAFTVDDTYFDPYKSG
jgi:hypothetical protein